MARSVSKKPVPFLSYYRKFFRDMWVSEAKTWGRDKIVFGVIMALGTAFLNIGLKVNPWAAVRGNLALVIWNAIAALCLVFIISAVRSAWRLDNERQEDFDSVKAKIDEVNHVTDTRIETISKEHMKQIASLKTELDHEISRHGGPKVFLAWEVPEEIAKLKGIVSEQYLYLENNSGEIAHNIQIDAIALGETVTFMMVHRLDPKQKKFANPMDEDGDYYRGGMIGFLNQQPNARVAFEKGIYDPHASGQISIYFRYHWKLPMTIHYTDGNGNPFCTRLFFLLDSGTGVGELELISCGRSDLNPTPAQKVRV